MFFERKLYAELLQWKIGKYRKPLILQGARQTGKTSLIKHFGATQFLETAYFNFEERPELGQIFKDTKQVDRILHNLSIIYGIMLKQQQKVLTHYYQVFLLNLLITLKLI